MTLRREASIDALDRETHAEHLLACGQISRAFGIICSITSSCSDASRTTGMIDPMRRGMLGNNFALRSPPLQPWVCTHLARHLSLLRRATQRTSEVMATHVVSCVALVRIEDKHASQKRLGLTRKAVR